MVFHTNRINFHEIINSDETSKIKTSKVTLIKVYYVTNEYGILISH